MTSREKRCVAVVVFGFLLNVYILQHPYKTYFTYFPLALPDPFLDVPRFKAGALPALLVVGIAVLLAGVWKLRALVRRPHLTICGIYLSGVCLHVALIASLADGMLAMEKRSIVSGHGEFLIEAVSVEDLRATLRDYEPYARQHIFLANKGPGVLVLFKGLSEIANAAPIQPMLDIATPSLLTLRWWLAEKGVELAQPQMERLRYLLALMLVLFPLLTLLPVFLVFWAGRVFVDDTFGLLAAQLYPVAPAIGLLVGHLDFALFPLCVAGIAVPFAIGVSRNRPVLLLLSAVVFVLYFTLTLAALSVLVFLAAYLGLVMLRRLRGRERIVRVTLDGLRVGGVFALVSILLLLVVCLWLPFDPVERYGYARLVQRDFVTTEYNLFWATTNLLGYFVSFGLMQTVLLVLQQGQALRRVWRATDGAIDDLAIAWLCLIVALVAFGRQHGETNRLWTFLTPVACLVVGTYVYERLSSRYLWVPLVAAFGLLIIGRHYLSYF